MNRRGVIGVDLGAHSIKAFQRGPGGGTGIGVHIPRDTPGEPLNADDLARLVGVLYRRGFSGTRVSLSAPKSIVSRLTMDLPPLDSGAPIDQIVEAEVTRQRHAEPGSFESRWDETPQPPRHASGARAIASSCLHRDADDVLDLFEDAGLDPVGLHDNAVCLAELAAGTDRAAVTAVLDLGWSEATFCAVRGGAVRFVRSIPSCGLGALVGDEQWLAQSLAETISGSLAGNADQDGGEFDALYKRYRLSLAGEIVSSIGYLEGCAGDETPTRILVAGGGALVPRLLGTLENETGLEVRPVSSPDPVLAMATALAAASPAAQGTDRTHTRAKEAA